MKRLMLLGATALLATGCYRTVYTNLAPPRPEQVALPARGPVTEKPPYWHHFFFWGVDPPEVVLNAAEICGGAEYIERIETEQSAIQAAIEAVVGYYVNIYSPYTGRVVCKPQSTAAKATAGQATAVQTTAAEAGVAAEASR